MANEAGKAQLENLAQARIVVYRRHRQLRPW